MSRERPDIATRTPMLVKLLLEGGYGDRSLTYNEYTVK